VITETVLGPDRPQSLSLPAEAPEQITPKSGNNSNDIVRFAMKNDGFA
jgi:hypothetical protein